MLRLIQRSVAASVGELTKSADSRFIAHGTMVAMGVKVAAAALTFGLHVILARKLGATDTGIFLLAFAIVSVISVAARSGMDNAVVKYVAVHAREGKWADVRSVFRWALAFTAGVSVILTIVTIALAEPIARRLFDEPDLTPVLQLVALSILPLVSMTLAAEAIKGLGRVFLSQLSYAAMAPLVTVIFLLAVDALSVRTAALLYDLGIVVGAVFALGAWFSLLREHPRARASYSPQTLFRTSWPLFVGALMLHVMVWSSVLILGVWRPAADVAVFGMASRVALATSVLLRSASSVVAPRFASLYHAQDFEGLRTTARQTTLMISIAALPITLVLLSAPSFFMSLLGPEFTVGGRILIVLVIGQFVNIVTGSVADLLMMTGYEKLVRSSLWVGAVLNVLLCVVLIPPFGAFGAAVAVSLSVIVLNVLQAIHVRRALGFWILPMTFSRT